jgi:hypothetical protein
MSASVRGSSVLARNDVAVKIDAAIVTKAKHVVISRRGRGEKLTLAEYLSALLDASVAHDYDAEFGHGKRPKGGAK